MPCWSSFTPHYRLTVASAVLAILLPFSSSQAQGRAVGVISDQRRPDSPGSANLLATSTRTSPARLALMMKEELGLNPKQVTAIEALVPIEADSIRARLERLTKVVRQNAPSARNKGGAIAAGLSWTGPIDEAAIRAAACEQAREQADMLIGRMRDRRALGAVLTTTQQRQFDRSQGEAMMRVLREMHK
jgi:hypothetical protein